MIKFLRSIGLLILLLFSFTIADKVSDVASTKAAEDTSFSVQLSNVRQTTVAAPNSSQLPDAELGGVYGHTFYKDLSSNVQRSVNSGVDVNPMLRGNAKAAVFHQEVLTRQKAKYHPASLSPITYPTCEFFVFALRHIII